MRRQCQRTIHSSSLLIKQDIDRYGSRQRDGRSLQTLPQVQETPYKRKLNIPSSAAAFDGYLRSRYKPVSPQSLQRLKTEYQKPGFDLIQALSPRRVALKAKELRRAYRSRDQPESSLHAKPGNKVLAILNDYIAKQSEVDNQDRLISKVLRDRLPAYMRLASQRFRRRLSPIVIQSVNP